GHLAEGDHVLGLHIFRERLVAQPRAWRVDAPGCHADSSSGARLRLDVALKGDVAAGVCLGIDNARQDEFTLDVDRLFGVGHERTVANRHDPALFDGNVGPVFARRGDDPTACHFEVNWHDDYPYAR